MQAASQNLSPSRPRRQTATSSSAAAPQRGPDYVRAKGKLLSRAGDWALAQIRMEHLEAYERGEMTMFIPSSEGSTAPSSSVDGAVWSVTPRVPSWFPRAPEPDSESHSASASASQEGAKA